MLAVAAIERYKRCTALLGLGAFCLCFSQGSTGVLKTSRLPTWINKKEEEHGFYKILPANTADHLYQLWQSCSNHHEIRDSLLCSGKPPYDQAVRKMIMAMA